MQEDGKNGQFRQTKWGNAMDKGSTGKVERYSQALTRMTHPLKGRYMSCRQITLTHSFMLEDLRRKKLAKGIKNFEDLMHKIKM